MRIEHIPYIDQGIPLEAFAAYPSTEKNSAVILCHAWAG